MERRVPSPPQPPTLAVTPKHLLTPEQKRTAKLEADLKRTITQIGNKRAQLRRLRARKLAIQLQLHPPSIEGERPVIVSCPKHW